MKTAYEPTEKSRVRRQPARASYDVETVHAVLDEALFAHVAFSTNGQPFVIPMAVARAGDQLVLHAARTSRFATALREGPVCVNVTLLDGVVLSRSAFHHSLNYRSVTVFGRAREVTDEAERAALANALVEQLAPGRMREVRAPDAIEWKATAVFALALDECAAKARSGGPKEDEADLTLPVWAGHIPLRMVADAPVPHESAGEAPANVRAWKPTRGRK